MLVCLIWNWSYNNKFNVKMRKNALMLSSIFVASCCAFFNKTCFFLRYNTSISLQKILTWCKLLSSRPHTACHHHSLQSLWQRLLSPVLPWEHSLDYSFYSYTKKIDCACWSGVLLHTEYLNSYLTGELRSF